MYRAVGTFGGGPRRRAREPLALLGRKIGWVAGEERHTRVRAVDGYDPIGIVESEVATHVAADVAACRAEPLVTENVHELGPQAGDRDRIQRRASGAVGVPIARHVGA